MRKIYLLMFSTIAILGISSCKKDWLCKCSGTVGTDYYAIPNQTKANANKVCADYEVYSYYTVCDLQ